MAPMETLSFDPDLIPARVAAGVAWLDAKDPDWFAVEDVSTLDMLGSCDCVLGQWVGNYYRALTIHNLYDDAAVLLGFMGPHQDDNRRDYWPVLEAEWKRVITAKQAAHAAKSAPGGPKSTNGEIVDLGRS